MEISIYEVIAKFLGGLGIFLFGLNYMSSSLQAVAGDRLRKILETGTKSPLRGVFTGIIVTGLIQSSTATTVLTIGLVNSGLLTLRRSIGIIMGANIGTTLTAFLIGFNLQNYTLPLLAVSVFCILFSKNDKITVVAKCVLGFSMLFLGLEMMGSGMKPLKDLPVFVEALANVGDNSILGVFVGVAFTLAVQSSTATIGVMQELAYQGLMTYEQCVPILFGDNIGTTVTALLASIGATVAAKRCALTHFFFNVIGTLIFLPLFMFGIFTPLVAFVTDHLFILLPGIDQTFAAMNVKLQIAQTHAMFNISNTMIQLPFIAVLAFLVTKLIPESKDPEVLATQPKYIDKRFLNNPSVALNQADREAVRMGELDLESFKAALQYWKTYDKKFSDKVSANEDILDNLEREITDYIAMASQNGFTDKDSVYAYMLMRSVHDLERIGDHCESIINQANYAKEHDVHFSGEADVEFSTMFSLTQETLIIAVEVLATEDRELCLKVRENENIIDQMQRDYRRNHIQRLNQGVCNGNNGAVFLELLGNLERISDLCHNIARYVMGEE